MTRIWEPGDQGIVRMIEPDGKLHSVRPVTVVADDGEIAAVQLVAGTTIAQPVFAERSELIASGRWTVAERTWTDNDVLILLREGDPYSPQLYVARDGSLKLWYVNLQDPVRRTSVGFDTLDHVGTCGRDPRRCSARRRTHRQRRSMVGAVERLGAGSLGADP